MCVYKWLNVNIMQPNSEKMRIEIQFEEKLVVSKAIENYEFVVKTFYVSLSLATIVSFSIFSWVLYPFDYLFVQTAFFHRLFSISVWLKQAPFQPQTLPDTYNNTNNGKFHNPITQDIHSN